MASVIEFGVGSTPIFIKLALLVFEGVNKYNLPEEEVKVYVTFINSILMVTTFLGIIQGILSLKFKTS